MKRLNPDAMETQFAVDRVERDLIFRLIKGEFVAGEYLPSVARLAKAAGVGHHTLRSALGRLISRGFLCRVAGYGIRVEQLLESCDIGLMLKIIEEKSHWERALDLEAQLLDLMSIVFIEVAYRAAGTRSEKHLEWFRHYLRVLHDRVSQDTHVVYLADAQLQLLRVLSASAGSVAFTVLLNSFRPYFLTRAAIELFPVEAWDQMGECLESRDVGRARQIFQRCFDRRVAAVLDQLSRARGGGDGGAAPIVELVDWGHEP